MAYGTAADIVQQAAQELGLGALADVWASGDANVAQLRALLATVGRRLVKQRAWTHLQKEYTFTTSGADSYPLPADFRAPLARTTWNRTSTFPAGNPLSGQQWQALKARATILTVTLLVRQQQGKLFVYPAEDSGSLVAYEYLSSFWVQPVGQTAPTADAPTANTDTVCFDALLLMQGLKVAWLEAKGFDATAAQGDFQTTLALVEGEDAPPSTLSLKGGSDTGMRLLDDCNVPPTGFGQ